jgi:hypothetical protein
MITPIQDLCDTFYACQIHLKMIDELQSSLQSGTRDPMDFSIRWTQQTNLYLKHLATIKVKSETVLLEGEELKKKYPATNIYNDFFKNTISFSPSKYVFPRESKELGSEQ